VEPVPVPEPLPEPTPPLVYLRHHGWGHSHRARALMQHLNESGAEAAVAYLVGRLDTVVRDCLAPLRRGRDERLPLEILRAVVRAIQREADDTYTDLRGMGQGRAS
jgi:hypothetical protein